MTNKEREEFQNLLETAEELRSYTHEWDWKYGEEWDENLERARKFLEDGDGTQRFGGD